jgi:hypothetical protein
VRRRLLDEMNVFIGDGQVGPERAAFRELLAELTTHYRDGERVFTEHFNRVSEKWATYALTRLQDMREGERTLGCTRDPDKCARSAWEDKGAHMAVVCRGRGSCRYAADASRNLERSKR